MTIKTREALAVELGLDRILAHQVLFAHRHRNETPAMHMLMILDWHGKSPFKLSMVFRGGAKTTIAEEAIIIMAGFQEYTNALIVSDTAAQAEERLEAIKHEIVSNEFLTEIFGDLKGPTWAADEIVLSNGIRIKAVGRGASIRGIKFHGDRPDCIFIDDLEDDENVDTATKRKKTKLWFSKKLLPACDPIARIRMAATPIDPDCLAEDLRRENPRDTRVIPIKYLDENGQWKATWESRFPLGWINEKEANFRSKGLLREFNMEYMCQATTESDKVFKEANFRVEPRVRTFEAVFAMFDPARTVGAQSATTGAAVWSWVGPKMWVWESWGRRLMPDEIIAALFDVDERFNPVWIGVEEDGLNQWLLQPIRAEMLRRGVVLPLLAVKAPRGKLDFIRGLNPFFSAHEIWFASDCKDLKRQLLNFPTGEIDAPNALAYAPRMRGGLPVYEDFGRRHVEEGPARSGLPMWLCLNAGPALVTGVTAQVADGRLSVFADFVREGDAGSQLRRIVEDAQIESGRAVRLTCAPLHFDRFNNVGLVQAAKALPAEMRRGVEPARGQAVIRDMLKREVRGGQALTVSPAARWTLNGFSAGYSRDVIKGGALSPSAKEGPYRTLLEGLESFMGLMSVQPAEDEDDNTRNVAYTPDGRRYTSAMVQRGR